MSFADAADYLDLVDDMPGATSVDWKLEELFQRDIDWDRVERGLVPYLRDHERPQFFNALTIALIPKSNDSMQGFDDSSIWRAPHLDEEQTFGSGGKIEDFGPVRCGYWQSWDDCSDDEAKAGQLAWNRDQVVAVAIDGQHRLAAIKEVAGSSSSAYAVTTIPVILVLLHPKLGFREGASYDNTLQTLRRLFIDLNKHARTVKRARQILLDDRDPVSICVRTLVGSQLVNGLAEIEQRPPALPLTLVDWHSEQARFDEGPYLTTILGLDWIVSQLLNVKPMESGVDYPTLERTIVRIERATGVDLSAARQRLEQAERYSRPFNLLGGEVDPTSDELARISKGFADNWAAAICKLLTVFRPYSQVLKDREQSATLRPEFATWYSLKYQIDNSRGQVTYLKNRMADMEKELKDRSQDPIVTSDYEKAVQSAEQLKSEFELAFTVVFQRALFLAFSKFSSVTYNMLTFTTESDLNLANEIVAVDQDVDEDEQEEDESVEASSTVETRATQMVDALNDLLAVEPGLLGKDFEYRVPRSNNYERFWNSSFTHPDGAIDFTQAASRRGQDLLLLVALMALIKTYVGQLDFEEFMNEARNATTGVFLKVQQAISRMTKENSIADKILKYREDPNRTQDARLNQILPRVEWLWQKTLMAEA